MAKNSFHKILSRIADIKPGEESISILLFCYYFLIMAPYYIIKPLRNASYLDALGAKGLPIAYLLTAAATGFIVAFHSKLQVKIPRHLLIISSLIFFILTCFLFWLFFPYKWSWLPLIYWIWACIFSIVLSTQFWILVNDIFNPREAKRLIGFFGSGGILGGIAGGQLTGFLAKTKVSYDLLLISSGMLIACIFIINYIFSWQKQKGYVINKAEKRDKEGGEEKAKVGFKDCFDTIRSNYYLTLLAAAVTIALVVSTLIDFQFNSVVEKAPFVSKNLTAFFGHFYAGLLVFSFFLQLLITSGFIKRFGIRLTLLLYPVILLGCSLGIAVFVSIYFAIIIKGSDKSLSYSLNQSVRELLYIPVSPEIKYKAKIFIDMFLNRFARSIGAVILMVLIYFRLGIKYVSIVSALLILLWVILNLKISREYVDIVKQKLQRKWERADSIVAEKVDVDYTKLVFDTLESKNRSSVLYAMHLFDLIKKDKLTPEVKKLISYKSDEIRIASLGTLFDAEEAALFPEVDDYISQETLEKDIKEIISLDVYQEVMKSYIEKTLANKGKEAEVAKMEVAKAIRLMDSNSPLVLKLEELLYDESPDVRRYAIESAAIMKKRDYVPALIQQLIDPVTRDDAIRALEKYGSKIVGTLGDYLGDSEEDSRMRKAVTSVLARIGSQEAADSLVLELAKDEGDMDAEIIDALDRIRSEKSDIQFSEEIIKRKIAIEIKKCYQKLINLCDKKSKEKRDERSKGLPDYLTVSLINIAKLLGLIYPHEDIFRAYQNIKIGTKDSVAYALELLDNILKKEIKDILFPIIEDLTLEERVKRCRNLLKYFPYL